VDAYLDRIHNFGRVPNNGLRNHGILPSGKNNGLLRTSRFFHVQHNHLPKLSTNKKKREKTNNTNNQNRTKNRIIKK